MVQFKLSHSQIYLYHYFFLSFSLLPSLSLSPYMKPDCPSLEVMKPLDHRPIPPACCPPPCSTTRCAWATLHSLRTTFDLTVFFLYTEFCLQDRSFINSIVKNAYTHDLFSTEWPWDPSAIKFSQNEMSSGQLSLQYFTKQAIRMVMALKTSTLPLRSFMGINDGKTNSFWGPIKSL